MNTFTKIRYAVRLLARFMAKPGRRHFKALKHLVHYLQCSTHTGGIKFYANPKESPLHLHLHSIDAGWATEYPIIAASDSSFQDCVDTGRSTGAYMIMMCGGVVDAATIVPNLVTHSTGEAEYCTAAMAMMACSFVRKIFNKR